MQTIASRASCSPTAPWSTTNTIPAGRLISKTVTGADGTVESTITQKYYGAYLIEVIDPAQRTAYRYDGAGRKIETRITLAAFGSAPASTYTIGTVFDVRGEPIEHRLADGRVMTVARDATERPIALSLKADGLKPSQPIVSGITAHSFNGITSVIHGNGVVTTRDYDSAGRIRALKTSGVLDLRYDYQAGPRIRAIRDANTPTQSIAGTLDYDGFGALRTRTLTQRTSASEPLQPRAGFIRTGIELSGRTPQRDVRGRLLFDDRFSYRYDALDRLITVHELATNRLVARYTYNAFGERVGKTTFDANGAAIQRHFLYQRSQLVAEIAIRRRHNTHRATVRLPERQAGSDARGKSRARHPHGPPWRAACHDRSGAAHRVEGNVSRCLGRSAGR